MRWLIAIAFLLCVSCDDCAACEAPKGPTPKHWLWLPVTLYLDAGLRPCQQDNVRWAVDFWHDLLDQQLFALRIVDGDSIMLGIPGLGSAALIDGQGRQARPGAYGSTFVWTLDGQPELMHSAEVRLPGCEAGVRRAYAHELGHVLGLLDNPEPGTLMHVVHDKRAWRVLDYEREQILQAR